MTLCMNLANVSFMRPSTTPKALMKQGSGGMAADLKRETMQSTESGLDELSILLSALTVASFNAEKQRSSIIRRLFSDNGPVIFENKIH